jgi:hypothetical protein
MLFLRPPDDGKMRPLPIEMSEKQTEGSLPVRAILAPQPCIRLDPPRVRTMKHHWLRQQGSGVAGTFFRRH